ncbi:hypothetical protein [Streptomyces sp. NPDC006463]|uniref:hypothetical protein n=1 Tax=Streptomyces sp. NPDC006463 TaxID=3364746 RepID=UPI0036B44034
MSPATLRRRLQQEGTSFQQLKDHVWRDAAIAGLAESGEPIAEFTGRSGAGRGTTPGAYRIASGG